MRGIIIVKLILVVVLASLLSCDLDSKSDNKLTVLEHENGLVLKLNYNYTNILKTEVGFKFHIGSEDSRLINEVEINRYTGIPEGIVFFDKNIKGDVEYYYKLERVEKSGDSGSGGDEYIYRIWKPDAAGGVMLVNYVQHENMPNFEKVWQIIQNIGDSQ